MISASDKTDESVNNSKVVVGQLKEQAQNVQDASNIIVDVISGLTEKVNDVQNLLVISLIYPQGQIFLH